MARHPTSAFALLAHRQGHDLDQGLKNGRPGSCSAHLPAARIPVCPEWARRYTPIRLVAPDLMNAWRTSITSGQLWHRQGTSQTRESSAPAPLVSGDYKQTRSVPLVERTTHYSDRIISCARSGDLFQAPLSSQTRSFQRCFCVPENWLVDHFSLKVEDTVTCFGCRFE